MEALVKVGVNSGEYGSRLSTVTMYNKMLVTAGFCNYLPKKVHYTDSLQIAMSLLHNTTQRGVCWHTLESKISS